MKKNALEKNILLLIIVMITAGLLFPKTAPASVTSVTSVANPAKEIFKTGTAPVIDGKLDDPVWQSALKVTGFKTFKPDFGKKPSSKTTAYAAYDKENFYFAFRCYDSNPKKIMATVTKRDNMFNEDWVSIVLDTFNDKQGGYGFFVNPLGIQGDGMMDINGSLEASHDMVWYSKGLLDDEGYTVEFRVPFKSIRFPGKKKFTMGILFIRQLMRQSEYASLPVIYPEKGSMLSQSLPVTVSGIKYKRVVELLPAFTSNRESSHREGELKVDDSSSAVSLTAKVGLTPSLTLDAAYNPDFSQVEADAGQVDVNLRYDLFYQEKRPFFLEGDEVFDFSGNTEDGPLVSIVHTRMIADPIFGLKLSGKISRRNTIAAIYAIDEKPSADFTEDAYFSIFRFRHALKNDSYIGAFYTGRDFAGSYNKIIGTDGRFRLSPISVAEYHFLGSTTKGRDEGEKENGHTLGLRYSLSTRKVTLDLGLQDVSKNFRIDSGFFTRTGITRLALLGILRIYPKSKFFQRIEPFYWSFHLYDKYSAMFETFNLFTLRFHMPGQTQFRVDFIAADEVFAGERFDRSGLGFQFYSQLSKYFAAQIFYRYTGAIYYDADSPYQGKGNHVGAFFEYLPAEKFRTSLNLSYVDFYRSADGEKIYDYTLLRSRTTFQLNKYLFFRGIAEYNFFRDELLVDLLASFTYIPGTVIHLGYGSIYEKLQWRNRQYLPADRFLETKRGFFFKVSYLWRL